MSSGVCLIRGVQCPQDEEDLLLLFWVVGQGWHCSGSCYVPSWRQRHDVGCLRCLSCSLCCQRAAFLPVRTCAHRPFPILTVLPTEQCSAAVIRRFISNHFCSRSPAQWDGVVFPLKIELYTVKRSRVHCHTKVPHLMLVFNPGCRWGSCWTGCWKGLDKQHDLLDPFFSYEMACFHYRKIL